VKSLKNPVVVYINHGALLNITKQFILTITYTNKLNLKYIRASEYLQRFILNIRYKSSILYYVFNALFRLFTITPARFRLNLYEKKLNIFAVFYAYFTTLVKMSKEFKNRIFLKYTKNKVYTRIKNILKIKIRLKSNIIRLPFKLNNKLIYKINLFISNYAYRPRRLCLPPSIIGDIFKILYLKEYSGHAKLYKIINSFWFIRNLIKYFREFLKYCSKYLVFQTRRYKLYNFL